MKVNIGDKFYIIDEDRTVYIYRVIRFKNEKSIIMKCLNTGDEIKTSIDEIVEDDGLKKLLPDAYILFNIVDLQYGMKDVIVSLFNRKDYEAGDKVPYAICRQSVEDVFSNQIKLKGDMNFYVGCSVSVKTVPEGIDYSMFSACNGIRQNLLVSAYIDDKFEDIISLVKTKNYDTVLSTLYNANKNPSMFGYCKDLRQLLQYTDFMYDFRQCFNIVPVNIEIDINSKGLDINQIRYIEFLLQKEVLQNCIYPYNKNIDLDKIQCEYMIISDVNENIFVLEYISGNNIHIENINLNNKKDAVYMIKSMMQKNI